jgi:spoIIIJ-associated protein
MGFEAELNVTDGDDFVRVDIDCEDPDLIAGGGEIFDALQYITNIVVSVRGRGKRVYVDFNGSQKKREVEMTTLANEIAEKVLASGEALKLEPMSAGDRRFIHRALTDVEGVSTRSEGEGAFRHLLVVPE